MRILAGILVLLTLIVGAFFGYCYVGAQMRVEAAASTVTPAADALGTYEDIRGQITNGSFIGEVYREADLLDAGEYEFLTITVRMANRGLFPMDWIMIEVVPEAGDILQLPAERTPSLAGGSRADFSTALLARAGGGGNRKVTVTYYVLGNALSVEYDMRAK